MPHQYEVYSALLVRVVLLVLMVLAAAKRSLRAWSAGMEPGKAPEHHRCPSKDGVRSTWS